MYEPETNLTKLVDQYFNVLKKLLDKHAPLRTKVVTDKPPAPWLTSEIVNMKIRKRQLERR